MTLDVTCEQTDIQGTHCSDPNTSSTNKQCDLNRCRQPGVIYGTLKGYFFKDVSRQTPCRWMCVIRWQRRRSYPSGSLSVSVSLWIAVLEIHFLFPDRYETIKHALWTSKTVCEPQTLVIRHDLVTNIRTLRFSTGTENWGSSLCDTLMSALQYFIYQRKKYSLYTSGTIHCLTGKKGKVLLNVSYLTHEFQRPWSHQHDK